MAGFFNWLVASHVTEPGSSLTEPGAVINFIDSSSHPGWYTYAIMLFIWEVVLKQLHNGMQTL